MGWPKLIFSSAQVQYAAFFIGSFGALLIYAARTTWERMTSVDEDLLTPEEISSRKSYEEYQTTTKYQKRVAINVCYFFMLSGIFMAIELHGITNTGVFLKCKQLMTAKNAYSISPLYRVVLGFFICSLLSVTLRYVYLVLKRGIEDEEVYVGDEVGSYASFACEKWYKFSMMTWPLLMLCAAWSFFATPMVEIRTRDFLAYFSGE